MADDDTTRIVARRSTVDSGPATTSIGSKGLGKGVSEDDGHTRIFRPKKQGGLDPAPGDGLSVSGDFSAEPVVGWLVVVEGPGKGRSLTLGYGMNSIGRAAEERVSLNFGDEEVTRHAHAMLTYDSKGRKFYIQHGGGTNLTYVGDRPVLQPLEITGRETIGIGNTKLCFVPLCGPDFEWQG